MDLTFTEAFKFAKGFTLPQKKDIHRESKTEVFLRGAAWKGQYVYASNNHVTIRLQVDNHADFPLLHGYTLEDSEYFLSEETVWPTSLLDEKILKSQKAECSFEIDNIQEWRQAHDCVTGFKAEKPSISLDVDAQKLYSKLFVADTSRKKDMGYVQQISFTYSELPMLNKHGSFLISYNHHYMSLVLNTLHNLNLTKATVFITGKMEAILIKGEGVDFLVMPILSNDLPRINKKVG